MVFNDTTNLNGAIQECETWLFGSNFGSISGNTTLLKSFTNLLNYGLDQTTGIILQTDGRWQYDDTNFTDITEGTTDLADGARDYLLDLSHLKLTGVEVKDNEGNFYPLRQIDLREIRQSGQSESEFMETSGRPIYYDVVGNILKLYPAPKASDVTSDEGLKVFYQRESDYFEYTDTSKELGLPRTLQDVPIAFACAKYAKQNSMNDKARELDAEVQRRTQDIKNFFNTRNVEGKIRLKARYQSSR